MKKIVVIALLSMFLGSISGGLTAIFVLNHRLATITVGQLVVTDKSGVVRASLGVDASSQVSLDLFNPGKTRQVVLGVVRHPYQRNGVTYDFGGDPGQQWAPLIELDEVGGRPSAMLTTAEHGNSIFNFYGSRAGDYLGVGYIGDGSDVRGPGVPYGAWGLRAQHHWDETSIGVLDYATAHGERYMFPNRDEIHRPSPKAK